MSIVLVALGGGVVLLSVPVAVFVWHVRARGAVNAKRVAEGKKLEKDKEANEKKEKERAKWKWAQEMGFVRLQGAALPTDPPGAVSWGPPQSLPYAYKQVPVDAIF